MLHTLDLARFPIAEPATTSAENALVPHKRTGGLDLAAGEAFLRANGIVRTPGFIADDFDDPLPEDFLIRPLPEP